MDIATLVRDLTPCEPYFADFQTTLDGLSKHVLHALNQCVGLIVVMHTRGRVDGAPLSRASVWVEQEIAIAAFMQQVLGRKLNVAAFAEIGLLREGLREALLLNPLEFSESRQVLEHLSRTLPKWESQGRGAAQTEITIKYKELRTGGHRHDYQLLVSLTNHGVDQLSKFQVDLEFPRPLLDRPRDSVMFVAERSNIDTGFFRATEASHRKTIFPGDSLLVMSIDYFVDLHTFDDPKMLNRIARALACVLGQPPQIVERPITELHVF